MRKLVTTVVTFLAVACGGAVGEPNAEALQQLAAAQSTTQARDNACGEPLKGPSSGTAVTTAFEWPIASATFTGTGNFSGLGLSQVLFPHEFNVQTGSVAGSMTITAANGDKLHAQVTGTGRPVNGALALDETATVTGGTGRFAGALGSFAIVGTSVNSLVTVRIDGYLVRNRECD
jgi:hypothetical protein